MMKFSRNRKNREQLRETMKQIEQFADLNTLQEADMLAGYVIGQVELKVKYKRLTAKQGDALVDMVFAMNDDARKRIEEEDEDQAGQQEETAEVADIRLNDTDYFRQFSYGHI